MRKPLPLIFLLLSSCMQGHYGDFSQGFADGYTGSAAMNQGAYTYNTYLLEKQLRESREAAEQQRKQMEELEERQRQMKQQMEDLERQRRTDSLIRSMNPYYPYGY